MLFSTKNTRENKNSQETTGGVLSQQAGLMNIYSSAESSNRFLWPCAKINF